MFIHHASTYMLLGTDLWSTNIKLVPTPAQLGLETSRRLLDYLPECELVYGVFLLYKSHSKFQIITHEFWITHRREPVDWIHDSMLERSQVKQLNHCAAYHSKTFNFIYFANISLANILQRLHTSISYKGTLVYRLLLIAIICSTRVVLSITNFIRE